MQTKSPAPPPHTSFPSSVFTTCAAVMVFVLAITLILYVTVDLELPRLGLFRISAADNILRELGAQFAQ